MKYPSYKYAVDTLFTGCSLGNYRLFARFDAETNARGLWCADDNQFYLGAWTIDFESPNGAFRPESTEFCPESQVTTFSRNGVSAAKRAFLPFFLEQEADERNGEMHALIYLVRIANRSSRDTIVRLRHQLTIPAERTPLFTKHPPEHEVGKRVHVERRGELFEIVTKGAEPESRILSSSTAWDSSAWDDRALRLVQEVGLLPGEAKEIVLAYAVSSTGMPAAREVIKKTRDASLLLQKSSAGFRSLLSRSAVVTPDAMIDRGIQWSKINTARVQHRYALGEAFTNDPPQDIVVVRDLAWYVLGADYLTPNFCRNMLDLAVRHAFHDGGKLTEYLHANEREPEQHDYRLNINDDTPLFVIAMHHHALVASSHAQWDEIYQVMRRASDWILSQMKDGLVCCDATGVNVWGICGWRNIIDGYTLSGAVTEVNAECYYALLCTADAARRAGRPEEAATYATRAAALKSAINTSLASTETGLYLLNRDTAGVPHHDVTGDLIFPVMFGVADEQRKTAILAALTRDDLWTAFGSRTVSRNDPGYDPDFGYQLMGGVWHNLTAWTAYCARHESPERLAEGMRNIYRLAEIERPRDYGMVVPGQFPERMHGETFVSRGMSLSPWMPPTFLWLAVEGLLGFAPEGDGLSIAPAIPPSWKWIAIDRLPWKGEHVSAFLYEGTLYSSTPVSSPFPVKVGELLEAIPDDDAMTVISLHVGDEIVLFAAAHEAVDGTVKIRHRGLVRERRLRLAAGEGRLIRFHDVVATTSHAEEPS